MSTSDKRLDILKKRNPFISSSTGDPWDNYPHVDSINKRPYQGLCSLIEQKKTCNSGGYAGLLLGEVGSGKTHLISRIQKKSLNGTSFSFAYIEPFEDADMIYRYLLREIIVNLVRPQKQNSSKTYLHKLVARIYIEMFQTKTTGDKYKELLSNLKKDPTSIFDQDIPQDVFEMIEKHAYEYIAGECPDISSEFLKVLFQFRIPEKKPAVLNWLKGDIIDVEDAEKIGVRDRMLHDPEKGYLEQEARYILKYIDILLARYQESLVVCFDRLENLDSQKQIDALGKIIEYIVDTSKSMIPIVCFRGQQWEEKFKLKLNQHITTRLENNKFELEGCDCDQALKIIKLRLESVLGEDCDGFFPFEEKVLRKLFGRTIESPREIITQANHLLRNVLELGIKKKNITPPDKLLREFTILLKHIEKNIDSYNPDRGRLLRAVDIVINAGLGVDYPDIKKEINEKDQLVIYTLGNKTTAILVNLELHHNSVGNLLRSGINFLKNSKDSKLFYIRDLRNQFPSPPKWVATNKKLDDLKSCGGEVLFLDNKEVSKWYALALLSYAVKEGDTIVADPINGIRSITHIEFNNFVKSYLENYDKSFFNDIKESLI
ncbi:MAG: hypothetical protein GY714_29055 [Desulfobacterales bacterium]|nr:hypothetical protein [Desulfobacterales bacterium]MCP4163207.1 hypothetical protein [Deltaproteobacteria bacterium]